MSAAKVNMSLDQIIKNNKKTGGGIAAKRRQANLARRQKFQNKIQSAATSTIRRRQSRGGIARVGARRGAGRSLGSVRNMTGRFRSAAKTPINTHKLVQNLVRKALNQRRLTARTYQRSTLIVQPSALRIGQRGRLNRGRGGRRGVGVVSGLARSPRVNRINQMVVARSSGVTDVHARLGWTGQQQKRSNIINQRRNLTTKSNATVRGRGTNFGRLASDIEAEIQKQTFRRQPRPSAVVRGRGTMRLISSSGRSRNTRRRGGNNNLVGYQQRSQPRIEVVDSRNSFVPKAGRGGFRAGFSRSQTASTLHARFTGGQQVGAMRIGVKQRRGGGRQYQQQQTTSGRQFYF